MNTININVKVTMFNNIQYNTIHAGNCSLPPSKHVIACNVTGAACCSRPGPWRFLGPHHVEQKAVMEQPWSQTSVARRGENWRRSPYQQTCSSIHQGVYL
ncbi:hypothetical protein E2C01_062021 [Portunus trituberculatus]|uniref:Uncharacterized protein n=1 Tax=Portunus trituberculatus TaxID=210409 RepID=A0A5B7HDZ1_PORTR|nr:hypothetical protein [Portunus trituberculatus]